MRGTCDPRFLPTFLVSTALLAFSLVSSPSAVAWSASGASGTGLPGRQLGDLGYLPLHPSAYARAKAEADARVASRAGGGAASISNLATALPSWQGLQQSNVTPPDPNGAIGPSRYVEMVNLQYGVYDRSGTLLAQGSLYTLTNDFYISDPEIIWDPFTQRFYYTMVDYIANTIKWGFSNSDKPDVDGFCNYTANFGYTDLPDYPRLGDTQHFLLVGVNLFANFSIYQGSDVDWMQKPPPSTTPPSGCPTSFNPTTGKVSDLTNSTPVPAVQTDPSTTGWVVAAPDVSTGSTANSINVFQMTESTGNFLVSAQFVTVPSFSMPASAPQLGTSRKLDTLDGRLERAVAGIDPNYPGSNMALWTAHAVAQSTSNPVAEERWYEIGVTTGSAPSLLRSGKATDPSGTVSIWNGAISPDRAVVCPSSPCTGTYGSHMAMTVNTSSTSQYPAIDMVTSDQPTLTLVQSSTGYDADFSCRKANSICRWGDYSGAMPDPTPGTLSNPVGAVWLTNEWNVANSNLERAAWRTWNWEAQP